jgi:O-methyltransferase
MLSNVGWKGRYICYDTFNGFVEQHFESDVKRGMPADRQSMFAANSQRLVRKILDRHGASNVELVAGDITKVKDADLAAAYSVVLLDIDLADPTYEALKTFWPRLSAGGVIYVDDCPENYSWKARLGYQKFCQEAGLSEKYAYGLGVLDKRLAEQG